MARRDSGTLALRKRMVIRNQLARRHCAAERGHLIGSPVIQTTHLDMPRLITRAGRAKVYDVSSQVRCRARDSLEGWCGMGKEATGSAADSAWAVLAHRRVTWREVGEGWTVLAGGVAAAVAGAMLVRLARVVLGAR